MQRIDTTIWDLALAIGESVDELTTEDREDYAFVCLVNLLDRALLEDLPAARPILRPRSRRHFRLAA